MSYQSLNIIGSMTAGVQTVQLERQTDRDRVDAYRAMMKDQVTLRSGSSPDEVDVIEDRMVVGDAPEEHKKNPYLFLRYNAHREVQEEPEDEDSGGKLDLVV